MAYKIQSIEHKKVAGSPAAEEERTAREQQGRRAPWPSEVNLCFTRHALLCLVPYLLLTTYTLHLTLWALGFLRQGVSLLAAR